MAVPELMRILLDEVHLPWDQAWDLTSSDAGLHQPHSAPRSAREVAARVVLDRRPSSPRDHPRDQPAAPRRRGRASPATRAASSALSLVEEGPEQKIPHGEPGDRRLAQHERRRRDPFRAAAHDDGQDLAETFPERFSSKDERGDAATLAVSRTRRWRARSPRPSATAG
jgi:hypothetical protein